MNVGLFFHLSGLSFSGADCNRSHRPITVLVGFFYGVFPMAKPSSPTYRNAGDCRETFCLVRLIDYIGLVCPGHRNTLIPVHPWHECTSR